MLTSSKIILDQILNQILARQWILVRAQHPQATDYNAPQIPAEWMLIQLRDGALYSSSGSHKLSRALTAEDLAALFSMRLLDPDRWNEEDFWGQYAREFDIHETHTNTDPIILCLPAQPHPDFGGLSADRQFQVFLSAMAMESADA